MIAWIIIAFLVGLIAGYVFQPLIKNSLNKLFKHND